MMENTTPGPFEKVCARISANEAQVRRELKKMREAQEAQMRQGKETPEPSKANAILAAAQETLRQWVATRDQPSGERLMARAVAAFNAVTGHKMTTREGWLFMAVLKLARATTAGGRHNADDYVDGAAYFALAGEEAEATGP